jgi:MPBQ/MSBQ methyltransferase
VKDPRVNEDIVSHYDLLSEMPEVLNYYRQSDYLNFGYWDDRTTDQREACENLVEHLLALAPRKAGRVLDVASGKGASTAHLLKYWLPEHVTGINISHKQLKRAQSNAPGCMFIVMDATDLGFRDRFFSLILCVEAAFHFYTRESFLKEAMRLLEPGGALVLSDILMSYEGEKKRGRRTVKNYVADPAEYERLMRRNGFASVKVIDATEACWHRHFWYAVRYFHRKFLLGDIDRERLEKSLLQTYRRVEDLEYYLLACGVKD